MLVKGGPGGELPTITMPLKCIVAAVLDYQSVSKCLPPNETGIMNNIECIGRLPRPLYVMIHWRKHFWDHLYLAKKWRKMCHVIIINVAAYCITLSGTWSPADTVMNEIRNIIYTILQLDEGQYLVYRDSISCNLLMDSSARKLIEN